MEVKFNTEIRSAACLASAHPEAKRVPADSGTTEVTFQNSRTLENTLASAEDVRPEAVERAKTLVGLAQYPPIETMHKLARLLAIELKQSE